MLRVLLTGRSGFVGQHLTDRLKKSGCEIIGLAEDFHLNGSVEDMTYLIRFSNPVAVVHLDKQDSGWCSWEDPLDTLEVSLLDAVKLFESARRAGVNRFVALSSAEVYKTSSLPLDEAGTLEPMNPYGVSKLAMEIMLGQLAQQCGMQLHIARTFDLIGPGQSEHFILMDWAVQIQQVMRGIRSHVKVGNLRAIRDLLDVRDAVEALMLLIAGRVPSGIYNICSAQGRDLGHVLRDLAQVSGLPDVEIRVDPDRFRSTERIRMIGSADKLQRAANWIPIYDWHSTLSDVIEHARGIATAESRANTRFQALQ